MEDGALNLCCCEYINIENERSHILGCCCNCVELDMCVDRLTRCQGMSPRSMRRLLATCLDRFRMPWKGGARQLSIDSVISIFLLPLLGYVASQGVWISVVIFSTLPIFLVYIHYISMRMKSQTKFFYTWTLTSVVLIVLVFELLVLVQLDICTEEHIAFVLFSALMVLCGAKTKQTAALSLVKGDMRTDDHLSLECAVCHKRVLPRTFHCSICRACIIERDQHCVWLDCCIGESNYRWYMATLVSSLAELALCSNLILTTACHPFKFFANIMLPDDCSDVYFDILFASMFVTALYCLLAAVFVLSLLLHECWLVSLGVTGHEWRALQPSLCCGLGASRPHSKGFVRNWVYFFLGPQTRQMSALTI